MSRPIFTLQSMLLPDTAASPDRTLYFREATCSQQCKILGAHLHIPPGCSLSFDTYFNIFDLQKWSAVCHLSTLSLEVLGHGDIDIEVIHTTARKTETLCRHRLRLEAGTRRTLELVLDARNDLSGLLYMVITAGHTQAVLHNARFVTHDSPVRLPRLALAITTFQREQAVSDTVAKLQSFIQEFEFGEHLHIQVVDNDSGLDLSSMKHTALYKNPNLGGSGGFSRNLIEAKSVGASHCLFMDDDASCSPEAIVRAYMFIAFAKDANVAIAGAMVTDEKPWEIWENGAQFDGVCRPDHSGTDMRDRHAVLKMLCTEYDPSSANRYGAWWFFLFPIATVTHYPFPFFVRGDDVNFSLANPFQIHTLAGVISCQENFANKENALTLYLDQRHPIVHHMVCPKLQKTAIAQTWLSLRPILRSLLRLEYSTAEAQLLAWQDVMQGPIFFINHIDMTKRRAEIQASSADEHWTIGTTAIPRTTPARFWQIVLGLISLNGYLFPGWTTVGGMACITPKNQKNLRSFLGAAHLTYIDQDRGRYRTLKHSKRRFWKVLAKAVFTGAVFLFRHKSLCAIYVARYPEMTSETFWRQNCERYMKREAYCLRE